MSRFRYLSLVLLLLCGAAIAAADVPNWPRFRGPNGAGIAAGQDIPVEWTDRDTLWRVPLPGRGNSSPVVWGDRLFIQSATPTERLLLCLRVADGRELWRQTLPGVKAHTHDRNSLASSTPATDGERVYALFWDGKGISLAAYDFEGKRLWSRELGGFKSQHGVGQSPMVHAGKVYLANDQDGSSVLLAFEAATGKPLWGVPRTPFRSCYSTPFILERPGQPPELVVASTEGITGYNLDSGTRTWDWTWKFDGMALRTVASPIAAGGLILASSGDGNGMRHTVAVKPGGPSDGGKGSLVWESKRAYLPYVTGMLARGEHVYFVSDKGFAHCHRLDTGAAVWEENLNCGITASPVLIDGKIYAASETGDVFVLAAEPTFKLLAKNPLGEPVSATPAVAGRRLFVRGQEHLFCIGRK